MDSTRTDDRRAFDVDPVGVDPMSLAKPWRDLDRSTVGSAPSRYAVYELGDAEGDTVGFGTGVLRDELKEALAYGDAETVRWELADSPEHAERLLGAHVKESPE